MALAPELQEILLELDIKSKREDFDWGKLPVDHPKIREMQKITGGRRFKGTREVWTEEMEAFLVDNYKSMSDRKLADALGLTGGNAVTRVRDKRYRMDLVKGKGPKVTALTYIQMLPDGTERSFRGMRSASQGTGLHHSTITRLCKEGKEWRYD